MQKGVADGDVWPATKEVHRLEDLLGVLEHSSPAKGMDECPEEMSGGWDVGLLIGLEKGPEGLDVASAAQGLGKSSIGVGVMGEPGLASCPLEEAGGHGRRCLWMEDDLAQRVRCELMMVMWMGGDEAEEGG